MKFRFLINDEGKILIKKEEAKDLIEEYYGVVEDDYLILTNYEAAYLVNKNRARVYYKDKLLSFEEIVEKSIHLDKRFWEKFLVYSYLRDKNFIVKEGYGGYFDFLLYEKKANDIVAKYIVCILNEGKSIKMKELDEILNFARNMRKEVLFAILDANGDVSFYEASKITLT